MTKERALELVQARKRVEDAKKEAAHIMELYAHIFDEEKEAKGELSELEGLIRAEIVDEYKDAKPADIPYGFKVKRQSFLDYEVPAAQKYAEENPGLGLIKLDVKAFEAIAAKVKPEFVTVMTKVVGVLPKEIKIDE